MISFIRIINLNINGIGADLENQTKLKNETGCSFACHYRLGSSFTNTIDVARSLGLNLRIDTVKDALTKMVSELNANKGNNKEFQIAIYTFSNSLVEHLPPTTNFNTVLASIE